MFHLYPYVDANTLNFLVSVAVLLVGCTACYWCGALVERERGMERARRDAMTRDDMPPRLRGHEGHATPPTPHEPPRQHPTIGRIVVYHRQETYHGAQEREVTLPDGTAARRWVEGPVDVGGPRDVPAVIHRADDPGDPESTVTLCALDDGPDRMAYEVPYGPGKPRCWSWPPRR